jgi:Tfp pilus assembly protein PilF
MLFPQITRNIPRIAVVLTILSGLTFYLAQVRNTTKNSGLFANVQTDQQNVNFRLLRAIDLEDQDQIDDARGQITTALDFDPANPYATDFYNKITAKSTNLDREIKNTLKILKSRPDYQKAWEKLATLYGFDGKTELANDAKQKSAELAKKM